MMTPLPLLSLETLRCHHLLKERGTPKTRLITKTVAKAVLYPHNSSIE